MTKTGNFREDLLYRINVFPITLPPLRDRKGDIPDLLRHFLAKKANSMGLSIIPDIAPGEIDRLLEYSWPGNIRELENLVERSLILNRRGPIRFKDLKSGPENPLPAEIPTQTRLSETLDTLISNHISRVMAMTRGKINGNGGAAHLLGINPSTLRHKMRKLKIDFGKKLQP
jgi:DNA-binding NtrC family response regulator